MGDVCRGFAGPGGENGGMDRDTVQVFCAVLGVATLAGGLVTLVALVAEAMGAKSAAHSGGTAWANSWLEQVRGSALWLMCAITTVAMVGSLYFSEVANFAPCKLCWYQRIAMYSMAFISFVAALRNDRNIARYTLTLASLGLVVSTYHYLLEWFPNLESSVCSIDVPCTTVWFREFGFVTLCFMAGSAFIAVIAMSLALLRGTATTSTSDSNN